MSGALSEDAEELRRTAGKPSDMGDRSSSRSSESMMGAAALSLRIRLLWKDFQDPSTGNNIWPLEFDSGRFGGVDSGDSGTWSIRAIRVETRLGPQHR